MLGQRRSRSSVVAGVEDGLDGRTCYKKGSRRRVWVLNRAAKAAVSEGAKIPVTILIKGLWCHPNQIPSWTVFFDKVSLSVAGHISVRLINSILTC